MSSPILQENIETVKLYAPGDAVEEGVPAFVALSISSFSPWCFDLWARNAELPYQIVLLPGYRRPSKLDPYDIHSMWYHGDVTEETVVWDGWRLDGLFEIITECFDPYDEMRDFIKIRDRKTREFIPDPRSEEFLAKRPRRKYEGDILSMERYFGWRAHRKALEKYYEANPDQRIWRMIAVYFRKPRIGREEVLRETSGSDQEDFLYPEGVKKQAIPGLRFGYALYEKEKSKHPEWHMENLRLEYMIKTGDISDELEIANYKATREIPMTDREITIYRAEKARRSKMTKDEKLDELLAPIRGKKPSKPSWWPLKK
ncbi:hypothetical protein [Celeribacter litoreus]|uniref:hypothetical protein n=1 Tax=Celeribacter litoreus TaxID=2876714 RepID=UPI001CCE7E48|nr:hypothetical protein [Celeribacter litoreus]MCA0044649.1 hypothetical protein [Celeribacter litoreus]